jgi:pyruvate dehydrogenase E2 component (dihydrolipoamide acetyltransferase)
MEVLMPQLGETVAEGKITKWFKSVGDAVKSGDNLFEIETDKVSMEVPAISDGVISEIRVQEGEVAPVGGVVAVIGEGNGAKSAASTSAPAKASVPSPPVSQQKSSGAISSERQPQPASGSTLSASTAAAAAAHKVETPAKAALFTPANLDPFEEVRTPRRHFGPAKLPNGATVTPLARRLAGEAGIPLAKIRGTGPHGRIVARDVHSAIASARPAAAALAVGTSADQVKALYRSVPFEEVALDGMRRIVATRLVEAKQTVPHFYLTADVDIERLMTLREEANAAAAKDGAGNPAFKLSVNDLVIKAFTMALQRVPAANAVWAGDRILRFQRVDVGVAVAVDGGLLTPVIREAEKKTVFAISAEMKDLAARARQRKLKPEEYQGGSASVSNLGMYGVRSFSAIINPPQSTILAVGAGERRPVEAKDGGIRFSTQMTITLSCDHRVVDGALGAQLLAAFKAVVENPVAMLI